MASLVGRRPVIRWRGNGQSEDPTLVLRCKIMNSGFEEDKDKRQGRKEIEGEYGKREDQNGRASIGAKGEY